MRISLKAARVNAGYTQTEASQALQVTKQTIINWEKGRTAIKAVYLDAMCRMYGVSREDVFLPENLA